MTAPQLPKYHGWICVDKPLNMGSTDVVRHLRRLFRTRRVGHAGTLDPLATGVLPVALNEGTKCIPYIQNTEKAYEFTVKWGSQTTTDDLEGEIIHESKIRPAESDIQRVLPSFIGETLQTPPPFSAVRIKGERAHLKARRGETVEIPPRPILIQELELLSHDEEAYETQFRVHCGKGTYVRALARDLGQKLGCFGHVTALRRTQVGAFNLSVAFSLEKIEEICNKGEHGRSLLNLAFGLDDILAITFSKEHLSHFRKGMSVVLEKPPIGIAENTLVKCLSAAGEFIGFGNFDPATGVVNPKRVFNI